MITSPSQILNMWNCFWPKKIQIILIHTEYYIPVLSAAKTNIMLEKKHYKKINICASI
jgi:hypothetical protein